MSAPLAKRPFTIGNVVREGALIPLCWTLAYFHLRPPPSSEPQVPAGAAYVDQ
jgi:hypothetical protein